MPRWSIVLPVLDGADYLDDALTRARRTMPQDAELRVMDDGSTDETPLILARHAAADGRIVLHRHEHPRGVSASLNELVAAGDSAYVGRLDADDQSIPGRWAAGERMLRRVDMAFTSVFFIDHRGRLTGADQPGYFSAPALPFHLLLGCCVVHPTAMMRRSALAEVGGYRATNAEDYELWLRSAAAGLRLERSPVPALRYRKHAGQVTARKPWMSEDEGSPLWRAYSALASRLLPNPPDALRLAFRANLHRDPVTAEEGAAVLGLCAAIEDRAASLALVDRVQLAWRLRRHRARIGSRLTTPGSPGDQAAEREAEQGPQARAGD